VWENIEINYAVLFILLFVVSIAGGMALKNILEYSMTIGVGLAMGFLLAAAFSLGKMNKENSSHN
jgi:hypothetical protein